MARETTPPYQPYAEYVMYSYDLGFGLQALNSTYDKLVAPDVPPHWQGVLDQETERFDIIRLSEAVNTTFQYGRKPRPDGSGYRNYDVPLGLGAAGLLSLTVFADAHVGYEALPDPRIRDEAAKSISKLSAKSSIGPYDIFTYADQLGYMHRKIFDEKMVDIHKSWMEERLPIIPQYRTYNYDYEAISNNAVYPVVNGVAFRGYAEYYDRPAESYEFDEDLMPLPHTPYTHGAPPRIGLTPAALAADTYGNIHSVSKTVHSATFSALLKYIKALRQAGLHDVKPRTP